MQNLQVSFEGKEIATEQERMLAWDTPHPNLMFDQRVERYSEFLEDGDFEKYMPVTAMKKDDPQYIELYKEFLMESFDFVTQGLETSTYLYDRQFFRLVWIRQRFNEFLGPEWRETNRMVDEWYVRITRHPEFQEKWDQLAES